jgi:hypothetical protein
MILVLFLSTLLLPVLSVRGADNASMEKTVRLFASYGDRSSGTSGNLRAAEYIRKRFDAVSGAQTGRQLFTIPVRRMVGDSHLELGRRRPAAPPGAHRGQRHRPPDHPPGRAPGASVVGRDGGNWPTSTAKRCGAPWC